MSRTRTIVTHAGLVLTGQLFGLLSAASAQTPGSDELARWLDERTGMYWQESESDVPRVDDGTFLRRVSLDVLGRVPSVAESRDFIEDDYAEKRSRLVDRMIETVEEDTTRIASEHLARIWRRMMLPPGSTGAAMGPQLEPWLRQQFAQNVRYDEMARRLVSINGGEEGQAGATVFWQAVGATPDSYANAVSRVFLGVRIGCAQCHDHPFTDWKQKDFWGMAAFFNGTSVDPQTGEATGGSPGMIDYEGTTYAARVLWAQDETTDIPDGQQASAVFAEWLVSGENPNFAATAVNRVWQHLFGRGLIAEVDDLDLATMEQRAILLDDLAVKFVEAGFDLRWLISGICKSHVYQCPTVRDEEDEPSVLAGRRPLKTLTPEQMFDSLEQALMLPISRSNEDSARHNGVMAQMVTRLDESGGDSPEEYAAGVPQVLMLMNGPLIAEATQLDSSRTLRGVVDAPFLSRDQKLRTLYLAAFTREPTDNEQSALGRYLEQQPDDQRRRAAYGEIFWALLNSPEFVLCR